MNGSRLKKSAKQTLIVYFLRLGLSARLVSAPKLDDNVPTFIA